MDFYYSELIALIIILAFFFQQRFVLLFSDGEDVGPEKVCPGGLSLVIGLKLDDAVAKTSGTKIKL